MDVYRTEEEQIAAIRSWWHEHHKAIIAAVVLAIASFAGWKWYQHMQTQAANEAAGLYQGMMKSLQEIAAGGPAIADADARFKRAGETLLAEHADSPYAQYAAMLMAGDAAEKDDYATAEKNLRSALAIDGSEAARIIIEHRLARVLSAQGKYDDALQTIATDAPEAFKVDRLELRGDVLLAQGKRGDARKAYQQAIDAMKEGESTRGFVQMKLDYVAGE